MDRESQIFKLFGEVGQGPGEFQKPISMGKAKDAFFVYDNAKPAILKFDVQGRLLLQFPDPRGSFARFSGEYLVIHSPFWKSTFIKMNLNGETVARYGEGMNDQVVISNAFDYIRCFVSDSDNAILTINVKGEAFEQHLPSGQTQRQNVGFPSQNHMQTSNKWRMSWCL